MKTGITAGAGYNLVASTTQGDMRLVAVVLGNKTDVIRFRESESLLTWGFRFYKTVMPIKPDSTFVTQRVWFGKSPDVKLGSGDNTAITLPRGQLAKLKATYTLDTPQLSAPLKKGRVVGQINYQTDGKTVDQHPSVVMEEVEESSLPGRIWDRILILFHQWFGRFFA